MPNRVVHFEIEAQDKDKLQKFYADAFKWQLQDTGPQMGNYIVITTGAMGDPKDIGINGGMFQNDKKELNAFSCTIGVEDIKKAIADVRAAGGKVFEHNMNDQGQDMGEVMDIPTVGKYAKCEDPEGNRFTLLEPDMSSMSTAPQAQKAE